MILVDTNILSEPLRREPSQRVLDWMGRQAEAVASAVSVGEMMRGALVLPNGKRRDTLRAQIDVTLTKHVGLILPYSGATARVYAHLYARRRAMGRPLGTEDGMIAATAVLHGLTLATRNVADFAHLGLEIINPWDL